MAEINKFLVCKKPPAVDKFGEKIKINVHFIPFCCLAGYEKCLLDEASKLDRYALNFKGFGYNIGEHLIKGAVKTERCRSCEHAPRCIGFFNSYKKELGIEDEFDN